MTTCKEATELMTTSELRPILWREKFALKVHLIMCSACRTFASQLAMIRAAIEAEPNADADNLLVLWAALSHFVLNDGGGPYSIEPWRKLWAKLYAPRSTS